MIFLITMAIIASIDLSEELLISKSAQTLSRLNREAMQVKLVR
jgi:hypothetical protein